MPTNSLQNMTGIIKPGYLQALIAAELPVNLQSLPVRVQGLLISGQTLQGAAHVAQPGQPSAPPARLRSKSQRLPVRDHHVLVPALIAEDDCNI